MKTIALFGAYGQANFGDDLMAVMIGRHLLAQGYKLRVFQLDVKRCGLDDAGSSLSIGSLLEGADACIIGGGGWLVPRIEAGTRCNTYRPLIEVVKTCESAKIPIWAMSIGGAGAGVEGLIPIATSLLLKSPAYIGGTVRLASDVDIHKAFGKDVKHFSDIVHCARDLLDQKIQAGYGHAADSRDRRTIGLNLFNNRNNVLFAYILKCAAKLLRMRVFLINTHVAGSGWEYELGSARKLPCFETRCYQNPLDFLNFLRDRIDVLVSSKLHVGLSALSLGCKVYVMHAAEKTRQAYLEMSMGKSICDSRKRLFKKLLFEEDVPNGRALEKHVSDARNHFKALDRFLLEL